MTRATPERVATQGDLAAEAGDAVVAPSGQASVREPADEARQRERLRRWRLVLGSSADDLADLDPRGAAMDDALAFLYDREYSADGRNVRALGAGQGGERSAGLGDSVVAAVEWLNGITTLFPQQTIERLEQDALERYGLTELVTSKDVLAKVEPSETLLKAVLQSKHLMDAEVLGMARVLVRTVVAQLLEKLAREVRQPFVGVKDPRRRSRIRVAANFDPKATVRRNLRTYDRDLGLVITEPLFSTRVRRLTDQWQIIILVDQSGSMAGSVIHSAVTAAIFHGVPQLRTHLIAFDTAVVDLTDGVADPVETLMSVQLGGGTDIGQAVAYAAGLVDTPARTIVVLISDLYEGGDEGLLVTRVRRLCESGVRFLALGAMEQDARAVYDAAMAARLVTVGAQFAVMTPARLAEWVAEVVL